ncbi:MAG: helix-turn-helix domain containing protein [Candidatus Brocadiia bacterium]
MDFIHRENGEVVVEGEGGSITIDQDDEVAWKLMMLLEGECTDQTRDEIAQKYDYSSSHYYTVRTSYNEDGSAGLRSEKRGPKTNYRRGGEAARQIIRYRFLDPDVSPEVIGQKLRQNGFQISDRSVYRVIDDYGLQKKGSLGALLRKTFRLRS